MSKSRSGVPNPAKRSAVFAESDISNAAADFIEAISEHAAIIWEPEDKEALVESLVDRAFVVLRGDPWVEFS